MPGRMQRTTWGEVAVGHIVRDRNDRLWKVTKEGYGWVQLTRGDEVVPMRKPDSINVVHIYVPSDEEALDLLDAVLGARKLRIIEEREHTIARQLNWRMEPVARNARTLRDHLDLVHQVPVDDVLRRWAGTEANPATPKTRKQALDELAEAHDYAHANPDHFPQPFPHVHTLEAAS